MTDINIATYDDTLPPIDLLSQAIKATQRRIETATTMRDRLRALWAGAKHARDMAASDVVADEFLQLAKDIGLANGQRANEDVKHVISWASRGMDPFGKKPIQ